MLPFPTPMTTNTVYLRPPCKNLLVRSHRRQVNVESTAAEGHRLDNLPVPSMPWRPCTDLCFF